MQSSNAGLGQPGRIRPGRVDTGERVFNNEPMVAAELLRRGLTNVGLGLDDAHWFRKDTPGKQRKYVVTLAYSSKDNFIGEYCRATSDALRQLASLPWYCHVWLNPNGVVTVNFVGLQNGEPQQEIVVRDRKLTLVPFGTDGSGSDGIDLLEVETILVKFFFTNPKRIPTGIPELVRASDSEMDRRHADSVK